MIGLFEFFEFKKGWLATVDRKVKKRREGCYFFNMSSFVFKVPVENDNECDFIALLECGVSKGRRFIGYTMTKTPLYYVAVVNVSDDIDDVEFWRRVEETRLVMVNLGGGFVVKFKNLFPISVFLRRAYAMDGGVGCQSFWSSGDRGFYPSGW